MRTIDTINVFFNSRKLFIYNDKEGCCCIGPLKKGKIDLYNKVNEDVENFS